MGKLTNRLDRQSFLGADSDPVLAATTVGFVGLGGGGSHIVQQLAHVGVGGFVLVDPDVIDLTNTNRLVGGTVADVEANLSKVEIAERLILGLQPNARVKALKSNWQFVLAELKDCDLLLGAVDSFRERDQLERFARRFLIPYIDIGMDVHDLAEHGFLINGQVILSSPGGPCLRCCNFITDDRLAREAETYGSAGGRPQVVWSNGVLGSTAVSIVVELLTPWHRNKSGFVYLEYDGNRKTVATSHWVGALESRECPHYQPDETGDPAFDVRNLLQPKSTSELMTPTSRVELTTRKPWWRRIVAR